MKNFIKQTWLYLAIIGILVALDWLVSIGLQLSEAQFDAGVTDFLLQFIFSAIGVGASAYFSGQSARKDATAMVKPHARSALLRFSSLYQGLARAAEVIDSAQQPEPQEDYQVTLARLQEIVAGQLLTADDALEDWRDILPEVLEVLEEFDMQLLRELRHEDTTEAQQ